MNDLFKPHQCPRCFGLFKVGDRFWNDSGTVYHWVCWINKSKEKDMKTVIEMARIAGARDDGNRFEFELRDLEFLVELVRADERNRTWTQQHWTEYEHNIRNATLDEIATKIEQDFKGAFGVDTCASWAAWIRSQKCEK